MGRSHIEPEPMFRPERRSRETPAERHVVSNAESVTANPLGPPRNCLHGIPGGHEQND